MNETITQEPSGAEAVETEFSAPCAERTHGDRDVTPWPDSGLIDAIRCESVDVQALDELIDRHWKPLFAHCQMLTVNPDQASELAQAAWRRILQVRQVLHPAGNLLAYLIITATNLWREQTQALGRTCAIVKPRDFLPGAPHFVDKGEEISFTGALSADLERLSEDEQMRLQKDIDMALGQLSPLDRDALLARYLNDNSCAEIERF